MSNNIIDKTTQFSRDFELGGELGAPRLNLMPKTTKLLREEVDETGDALYKLYQAIINTPGQELNIGSNSQTAECITNIWNEIVDGFGDSAFVAINGIYKCFRILGRDHEDATESTREVMRRICNANLSKINPDGSVEVDEDGKVVKPADFTPPDHRDLF